MNKKTKTNMSVLAVLLIWGFIGYRSYQNHQVKETLEETENSFSNTSFSPLMFNKDSFELDLPDLDPFLKKPSKSVSVSYNNTDYNSEIQKQVNHTNKTVKTVPVVAQSWPQIKYMGFVKNRDQNKTLCLLKINNRTSNVGKGEEKAGVYVSNVFRDSVHLVFNGEERTFLK